MLVILSNMKGKQKSSNSRRILPSLFPLRPVDVLPVNLVGLLYLVIKASFLEEFKGVLEIAGIFHPCLVKRQDKKQSKQKLITNLPYHTLPECSF
jgi:uncharacterized sodium:solute symporter family permease YidK